MRFFRKEQTSADISMPEVKETMKMLGLEPGSQVREFFGWTEKDDTESQEIALSKMKRKLSEIETNGATLREVMALEISIKGTENWLKANNHI